MKKPELSFHGQIQTHFGFYLKSLRIATEIRQGKHSERRRMCYSANLLGEGAYEAIASKLEVQPELLEMEIFFPTEDFPPHVDGEGESFMIPLEDFCVAKICGTNHSLLPWGIYSFDDRLPHSTHGVILMIRIKNSPVFWHDLQK